MKRCAILGRFQPFVLASGDWTRQGRDMALAGGPLPQARLVAAARSLRATKRPSIPDDSVLTRRRLARPGCRTHPRRGRQHGGSILGAPVEGMVGIDPLTVGIEVLPPCRRLSAGYPWQPKPEARRIKVAEGKIQLRTPAPDWPAFPEFWGALNTDARLQSHQARTLETQKSAGHLPGKSPTKLKK